MEGKVMVELKANHAFVSGNGAQLVNYLVAAGMETGLLLNFGAERLEFRRKTRTYRPRAKGQDEQVKGQGQDKQDLQDSRGQNS